MRIGIDIDGVCYKWVDTALYMMREVLPNSPYRHHPELQDASQHTSWYHIPERVDKKHWKWLWKEGIEHGMFRHGHLYPGTPEALKKLAELGRLVAITQRPHRAAQDTFDWISYHRLPFEEVHVLQGGDKTVVQMCDLYIDDKPENCVQLKTHFVGPKVCIPDRPWNKSYVDDIKDGVRRVYDWEHFIDLARLKHEALSGS